MPPMRPRGARWNRGGIAGLDRAWAFAGCRDGDDEFGVHVWDMATGAVIVIAAGGEVQQLPTGQESAHALWLSGPAAPFRVVADATNTGIN